MIFNRLWTIAAALALLGCVVANPATRYPDPDPDQISQLLPTDAILLGEQHDAPDHQRIHRLAVETLARQHTLAALALEMASAGQSTAKLGADAGEDQVRTVLQWNNALWPWAAYGPAVMAAVRAGVPVVGANLTAVQLRAAMANASLDRRLPDSALKVQQQNIRRGHCELLPESQISPMTRVQIARDIAMAQALILAAVPGKTVVLLAGSAHVDRTLGVPQHLPAGFRSKTVLLQAEQAPTATKNIADFDHIWATRPMPAMDYCADFTARRGTPAVTTP